MDRSKWASPLRFNPISEAQFEDLHLQCSNEALGDPNPQTMATGEKKKRNGGRPWGSLNHDLLVFIFRKLGVADLIAGVRLVCSSWRTAARDPICWLTLDFREWDSLASRIGTRNDNAGFVRLLRFAVHCGHHLLKSIYFPSVAAELDLLTVAKMCPRLEYFSLPNPVVDQCLFCNAISNLRLLRGMAVDENMVKSEVLQHADRCCVHLTELRVFARSVDVRMASTICKSLSSLRKLEITESIIRSRAIITFLDELKELEHLDISGYENSAITDAVLNKASRLKVFIWHSRFDLGEFVGCSNWWEESISQESCEDMMDVNLDWLTELS